MSKREPVQLTVFFLLFWFAVLLFSMTIHEMGHALTVAFVGGWRNSTAFFGGAAYHEPSFLLAMVDQVQASGLTPSEWGMEQNFQLMGDLARQVIPFRFGVIGGWLGQLAAVLIVYLIFRSHTFQVGGSSFSRLFWGCFMFFNLAWIGGLWFLDGLWAPNSSDSVVLVNIILERNPLALGALWLIGVALVGLSLFLANRYGGVVFSPLGLNKAGGRRLALLWAGLVAVTALPGKLPLPARWDATVAALIAIPLMTIGPTWLLARWARRGEPLAQAPAYAWLGSVVVLALVLFGLATRSGFIIQGDLDLMQIQVIQAHYCEQVNCVPEEIMRWFR